MIRKDIEKAWHQASKDLDDYIKAKKGFKSDYYNTMKDLLKNNPTIEVQKKILTEPLYILNKTKNKPVLLIANFFGNEVFATLSLLLCLEDNIQLTNKIYAIPLANNQESKTVDQKVKSKIIEYMFANKIPRLVIFSQGHPYLDGFYIKIPASKKGLEKAKEIIEHVTNKHEVGAFSAKYDKPTYTVITADENELISQADRVSISAYEFFISNDILAGHQALLKLLNTKTVTPERVICLNRADMTNRGTDMVERTIETIIEAKTKVVEDEIERTISTITQKSLQETLKYALLGRREKNPTNNVYPHSRGAWRRQRASPTFWSRHRIHPQFLTGSRRHRRWRRNAQKQTITLEKIWNTNCHKHR